VFTDNGHSPGGAAHGSLPEYLLGLSLSVILTAIPFAVVMSGALSIVLILLCAIGQVMVQLIFFLHMNTSSAQIWNSVSGVFVLLLVIILIVGSLWIMQHLNHNMLMGH